MATKTVTVHQAKTNLSKLIKQACAGEEIIIARGSEPVVQLVPVKAKPGKPTPTKPTKEHKQGRRQFGLLKGKFTIGPEFFDPLPEDELKLWNGED